METNPTPFCDKISQDELESRGNIMIFIHQ